MRTKGRIVLGVTTDGSLDLMHGFPEFLTEQGWDVHVVCSPGPRLAELALSKEITTHAISMARGPSPAADFKALVAWIQLFRRLRPDLISVGTPKAGLLGGIAGVVTSVPRRVYLLRGLRLETTSGLQRKVLTAVEKIAISASHQVLSVSRSLRSRAIEAGVVAPGKIVVLGEGSSNGVDVARFDPSNFTDEEILRLSNSLGLICGIPVLGFVGRLTKDKGLEVLAEAREIMARNGVDYQLLIVGGMDDKSGDHGLSRLREAGRPAIVTGHVADTAIYYQVMDLLCLPSLREGFPNVVLEAAASMVPAVTTTATGAVDSVVDGHTGLLAKVSSAEDLAGRLTELLSEPERTSSMGRSARSHVLDHYTRLRVWEATQQFYADFVQTKRRKKGLEGHSTSPGWVHPEQDAEREGARDDD